MKQKILKYFIEELIEKPLRAEEMYKKLERHPDILCEFEEWLDGRNFPGEDSAIVVEGFSAKILAETTYLEPIGVYNYLIYLREKPSEALNYLKKGLPRK